MQQAQLLMVAGFILLCWVLVRRQVKLRKRVNKNTRVANRALKALRERRDPAVPLSDAPPETQRWQIAMFDLQRELKAELESRIVLVQTLIRQLDQRIERLSDLESKSDPAPTELRGYTPQQQHNIVQLARAGHSADEIASQFAMRVGDVQRILQVCSSSK